MTISTVSQRRSEAVKMVLLDPTRLPAAVQAKVREWLASEDEPVAPRDAAAIVLLRDGRRTTPGSAEAFFLRRHAGMAFAAGVSVFPGGGVDVRDTDAVRLRHRWIGPPAEQWADRLGVSAETARGAVCAAVRETFEETGVLFAGHSPDSPLTSTTGPDWEQDRQRVERRDVSLAELIEERGLLLRADLLQPWSVWVTPVFEPRRYRTFFFVAEVPRGQDAREVSSEADGIAWSPVREALLGCERLLPPQMATCLEILEDATAGAVLRRAAGREVPWVLPEPTVDDESVALQLPASLTRVTQDAALTLRDQPQGS